MKKALPLAASERHLRRDEEPQCDLVRVQGVVPTFPECLFVPKCPAIELWAEKNGYTLIDLSRLLGGKR